MIKILIAASSLVTLSSCSSEQGFDSRRYFSHYKGYITTSDDFSPDASTARASIIFLKALDGGYNEPIIADFKILPIENAVSISFSILSKERILKVTDNAKFDVYYKGVKLNGEKSHLTEKAGRNLFMLISGDHIDFPYVNSWDFLIIIDGRYYLQPYSIVHCRRS